jgi:hypothetical protein
MIRRRAMKRRRILSLALISVDIKNLGAQLGLRVNSFDM